MSVSTSFWSPKTDRKWNERGALCKSPESTSLRLWRDEAHRPSWRDGGHLIQSLHPSLSLSPQFGDYPNRKQHKLKPLQNPNESHAAAFPAPRSVRSPTSPYHNPPPNSPRHHPNSPRHHSSSVGSANWGFVDLSINTNDDVDFVDNHTMHDSVKHKKLENDFDAFTASKAADLAKPLREAQIPYKIHIVKDHDMKERLCLKVARLELSAVIMGS